MHIALTCNFLCTVVVLSTTTMGIRRFAQASALTLAASISAGAPALSGPHIVHPYRVCSTAHFQIRCKMPKFVLIREHDTVMNYAGYLGLGMGA
jgi:hypothetical protein